MTTTDIDPTTNGHSAMPGLEALHEEPVNPHLFRGYGPLVVGLILFVLMVVLTPTVAPEHVVDRPLPTTTTTSTVASTTTSVVTIP